MSSIQQSDLWTAVQVISTKIQEKSCESDIIAKQQSALYTPGAKNVSSSVPYKEFTKKLDILDEEIEDLEKKRQVAMKAYNDSLENEQKL
jgi:hypothetical protein